MKAFVPSALDAGLMYTLAIPFDPGANVRVAGVIVASAQPCTPPTETATVLVESSLFTRVIIYAVPSSPIVLETESTVADNPAELTVVLAPTFTSAEYVAEESSPFTSTVNTSELRASLGTAKLKYEQFRHLGQLRKLLKFELLLP